jgi:hypothetical protein
MQRPTLLRSTALSALLMLACAQAAPTAAPPPDVAAAAAASGSAPPDPSLTVADYVAAGVPDPARPWSANEMAVAARVLNRLAAGDPSRLPAHGSARSGALFARITSAENAAVCRMPSAPGDVGGLTPCIRLGLALDAIVKSYANAPADDLAMVFASDLRAIAALIRLSDQYAQSSGENPELFTALVSAEGTRKSTPRLVADSLIVMREPGSFGPGVVESYLDALRDALPVFFVAMDPAERDRLLPLLAAVSEDPAKRDFRAAFEQLSADVDAALRAAPASSSANRIVLHRGDVCTEDPYGGCLARSTGGGFSVWLPAAFDDMSADGPIRSPYGSSTRAVHMLGASDRVVYEALKFELAGTTPTAAPALDPRWEARGFTIQRGQVETSRGTFDELRLRSDAETLIIRSRRVGSAVYRLTARYRADVPEAEVQAPIARFLASLDVGEPSTKTVKKKAAVKKPAAKKPRAKKTSKKKR